MSILAYGALLYLIFMGLTTIWSIKQVLLLWGLVSLVLALLAAFSVLALSDDRWEAAKLFGLALVSTIVVPAACYGLLTGFSHLWSVLA